MKRSAAPDTTRVIFSCKKEEKLAMLTCPLMCLDFRLLIFIIESVILWLVWFYLAATVYQKSMVFVSVIMYA